MFAAAGTLEVTSQGKILFAPLATWKRDGLYEPPDGIRALMDGVHPSWTTVVFRTEVRDLVGCFYNDLGEVADIEYTFRIAARFPFAIDRRPAGVFVRHPESRGEHSAIEVDALYDTMLTRLISSSEISDETRAILEARVPLRASRGLLQLAIKSLCDGDAKTAREALRRYHARSKPVPISVAATVLTNAIAVIPPLSLVARLAANAFRMRVAAASSRQSRSLGHTLDPEQFTPQLRLAK
jgi:hypothetical protein